MNAPVLWIILPLGLAAVALLFRTERNTALFGGSAALLFCALAFFMPVDTPITVGSHAFKISSSLQVFGRTLRILRVDEPMLALFYGLASLWFFGAGSVRAAKHIVPLGMAIMALLIASLAVEPFLYAALLIEIAVLLAVALLSPLGKTPQRGVIRFLIFQTLGMPFILLAGWLLAGVEAGPGNLTLVLQSTLLLGLGFAFLLAVFPLYTWIPMVAEESSPYAVGFLLWVFPTAILLFGVHFLDRYTWLRESAQTLSTLRSAGLLMVTTGGIWAAFQRHLGRIMGYAAITGIGAALLALSQPQPLGLEIFFWLIVPRALALMVWALSLEILTKAAPDLRFRSLKGAIQRYPIASGGAVLAHLSIAGFPLLAGFPAYMSLWESLAKGSLMNAFWFGTGIFGLTIGLFRTMATLVMAPENSTAESLETLSQRVFITAGVSFLVIFGIFPQWLAPILENLAAMFEHLVS
jgi:multicomponent Na+:H+ antiporter subunit D